MSIARECFNNYILMHLELSATCQVALGVGIPVTFLLTAIISSLLAPVSEQKRKSQAQYYFKSPGTSLC